MIGLYSINLERFLLVKEDRWIMLIAAKLLSSKYTLSVVEFENSMINDTNCYTWGIKDSGQIASDRQIPRLQILEGNEILDKKNSCPDVYGNQFDECRKYCDFVYKTVLSSRMVDALLNTNDQKYILSLFNKTPNELQITSDDTGLDDSFLINIDKILYFSQTIDEAKILILQLLETQTNMVSNFNNYKKIFRNFLEQNEINL